ncbi:MAG: glycoside hydrolase family 25 protein [Lachnospiraceae bacterium]|nr:glycoside hydrolase family 25 protein [Lachnospiraceae bacterium]
MEDTRLAQSEKAKKQDGEEGQIPVEQDDAELHDTEEEQDTLQEQEADVTEGNDAVKDQDTETTEPQGEKAAEAEDFSQTGESRQTTLHFVDAWGEWHDAVIDPAVSHHTYDWNCLKRNGDEITYENDPEYTIRKGVDVSHHQGAINWEKVKAAGYEFAFLRIGYRGYGSAGTLGVDKRFAENLQNAHAAGLDVGVYFFSQAVNETEAEEEAELVLSQLSGAKLELPVVYDPELIRDTAARTDDVSGEQFTKNTQTFCEKVRAAGYDPMIYSNMVWEGFLFDMKALENYPVWYADYEPKPQTPYHFVFWQYSEKGHVDGIDGIVDLDVQFVKKP